MKQANFDYLDDWLDEVDARLWDHLFKPTIAAFEQAKKQGARL